jgi:hypothetical protein
MSTVMAILIYFILDINWSVPSGDIYHVCDFRIYAPVLTSVVSNKQRKSPIIPLSPTELKNGCKLGTDSHAEVTCYGRHARITHMHEARMDKYTSFIIAHILLFFQMMTLSYHYHYTIPYPIFQFDTLRMKT